MNRLQMAWQRLYGWSAATDDGDAAPWIDVGGCTRVMVLDVGRPVDWPVLAVLGEAVQAELDLPAPAIAVNGVDGYQLWFSLQKPVPHEQARAFLQGLCRRYLAEVPLWRVRCFPGEHGAAPTSGSAWHPDPVPHRAGSAEQWSAFVAPGLAALLAQEPWLDHPPSADAQADLLSRQRSMDGQAFQAALSLLQAPSAEIAPVSDAVLVPAVSPSAPAPEGHTALIGGYDVQDPKGFLLAVMNDPTVPLVHRMEAAKALLPFFMDQVG